MRLEQKTRPGAGTDGKPATRPANTVKGQAIPQGSDPFDYIT